MRHETVLGLDTGRPLCSRPFRAAQTQVFVPGGGSPAWDRKKVQVRFLHPAAALLHTSLCGHSLSGLGGSSEDLGAGQFCYLV